MPPGFVFRPGDGRASVLLCDRDIEKSRRPAVVPQQTPDPALDNTRRPGPFGSAGRDLFETFLDPLLKTLMDRPLLLPPRRAAAQDEGLRAFRPGAQLHLQTGMDRLPILARQMLLVCFQHAPRGAHDVPSALLLEKVHVFIRYHAPVKTPDPIRPAVAALHGRDDLLEGRHIAAVAGKDLVAQRQTFPGHHQADAHLLAVGPVVP